MDIFNETEQKENLSAVDNSGYEGQRRWRRLHEMLFICPVNYKGEMVLYG